jgi:DNA-binding MarR family transcriptional regulator
LTSQVVRRVGRLAVDAPLRHAGHPVPEAWVRLLAAHASMTSELDAELRAEHGLTLAEYEVLLHLSWAQQGRLRRSDLARQVFLTQGGITRLVHRLEDARLITSVGDTNDGRVVHTQLTKEGRRRLARAAGDHVTTVDRMFTDHFTATELRTLADLLERVGT